MTEVTWLVHDRMLNNTSYANLPQTIKNLGYSCHVIKNFYDPIGVSLPQPEQCVIPYCTINVARQLPKYFGTYLNEHNLKMSVYTSLLQLSWKHYLNSDALLKTFYQFRTQYKKQIYSYFDYFCSDNAPKDSKIFIRPDTVIKPFTGYVIAEKDFEYELNFLQQRSALTDDSLIWVSSAKTFSDETRFIICGDNIVDGSRYSRNSGEEFIEDKNFPKELYSLAKIVAECSWKPDEVFVVDLCMTDDGPKIVELNSFSAAGWYACDTEKVIKAVSEHTIKLYNEQNGRFLD